MIEADVANGDKDTIEFVMASTTAPNRNDDEDDVKLMAAPTLFEIEQRWTDDPSEFEEYEYDDFAQAEEVDIPVNIVSVPDPRSLNQCKASMFQNGEPFVVLIRHGRTPHNNLGLFTGWEDPPLADGGVEDARNAGRLLKRYVVYSTLWEHS